MTVDLSQAPLVEPDELGDPDEPGVPTEGLEVRAPGSGKLVPWLELRHILGRSRDRRRWLQFLTAITGYRPFQWQVRMHLAHSPLEPDVRTNKLITAGVRAGKTEGELREQEELHLFNPGPTIKHVLVAPTYDQVREVLLRPYLSHLDDMARAGYPLLKHMNWSLMRADLHCGASTFFRSADKIENTRGFEFATFAIDEGDYTRDPQNTWNTLSGRLSAHDAYVRQGTVATSPAEYGGSIIQLFDAQRAAADDLDPEERSRVLQAWWYGRVRTLDNPTLPPDYIRSLYSLSRPEFLKEVLGYPVIKREAQVFACFSRERHLADFEPDPRRPYDIGCDWGLHRPSYFWFQLLPNGRQAVIFDEWHPENVGEDAQLEYLARQAKKLGKAPEAAGVDWADVGMVERLKKLFPDIHVPSDEGGSEQSRREASAKAWLRMLDPIEGEPALLVSTKLATTRAPRRGVVGMLEEIQWEWDSGRRFYRDVAAKDGFFDHAFDAGGYWARRIGIGRRRMAQTHEIVRGQRGGDDFERLIAGRNRL